MRLWKNIRYFIQSKYAMFSKSVQREQFGFVGAGDYINPEKLLADFFGIDLEQAERERQHILTKINEASHNTHG